MRSLALQSLESNPQLSFATRMEDWTSLGQHKRHPEFPDVTRESRRNSRKTTDRKSTRLNSSHQKISYAVFCLKKKKKKRAKENSKNKKKPTQQKGHEETSG